jgi:ketosteroid isomerase-like protein
VNDSFIEIAERFSLGEFETVFQFLADDVIWNIVGENKFTGKTDVISNCRRTAEYFNTVETNFKTDDIISEKNKVVIIGNAQFSRDGKRINFVRASDIYEFDKEGKLEKITSYCIPEK